MCKEINYQTEIQSDKHAKCSSNKKICRNTVSTILINDNKIITSPLKTRLSLDTSRDFVHFYFRISDHEFYDEKWHLCTPPSPSCRASIVCELSAICFMAQTSSCR